MKNININNPKRFTKLILSKLEISDFQNIVSNIKCIELIIKRIKLDRVNSTGLEKIFQNNVKKLVLDSAINFPIFENYDGQGSLKSIEITRDSTETQEIKRQTLLIKAWTEKVS